MEYKEFTITDNGYALTKDNCPVEDISGLSNEGDERFYHCGCSGIPETAMATVHFVADRGSHMLFAFVGTLDDGVDVAQADVLAKLKAEYGFPSETTIGDDGRPIVPKE